MKLQELLINTDVVVMGSHFDTLDVLSVTADSRKTVEASLFVALPGPKTHGQKFIAQAIAQGAKVIVSKEMLDCSVIPDDVLHLVVDDPQKFLVAVLKNFYREPSKSVKLIGITGTNGKTTITYLLESLFAGIGKSCGVIGTINHRYGGKIIKAANTTPGLVDNFALVAQMSECGVSYCAMEVSSHALDQGRVEGLGFRYGVFTNLTSDHLDYHKTRENYFLAKSKLFTSLGMTGRAIINIDDEFGERLQKMTASPVWTYGIKTAADFCARNIDLGFEGSRFDLLTPIGSIEIKTKLIGLHNIYNILSVAVVGVGEGLTLERIKKGIESLIEVPGRLERIEAGQDFYVFVDYAHTEDALRNVLSSIRAVKKARVIVVFGCGGDRDKTKRPLMAGVVEDLSDFAIVTSDNPRSEDPQQIIREIVDGFKKKNFKVVADRKTAIAEALSFAQKGDVVIIAGKGHEDYQIFKDETIAFDEREIVRGILNGKI